MKEYTFKIKKGADPNYNFDYTVKTDKGLFHAIDTVTAKFNISEMPLMSINIK